MFHTSSMADDDLQFFRQRDQRANVLLRARPGILVTRVGIDDGGNQQHGFRSPELGVVERGLHAVQRFLHHGGVAGGERVLPVGHVHDGMDGDLGIFRGLLDFLGHLGVFHRLAFHALEPYVAGKLEAVGVAHFLGQHVNLHGLLDASTGGSRGGRSGGQACCRRAQRSQRRRAGSAHGNLQKIATRWILFHDDLLCWVPRRLRKPFSRPNMNVHLAAQGDPGAAAQSPEDRCPLPVSRLAGSDLGKLRDIDFRIEHFLRLLQFFPSEGFAGISRVAAQHGAHR